MRLPLRPILDVLRSPLWSAVALLTSAATFLLAVWLPNLGLITDIVRSTDLPATGKLRFLWNSLGAIATNFTTAQAALLVVIAVLFGLNLAVTLQTVRQRSQQRGTAGIGLAGIIAGLLGVGCSACGAIILSTLLGAGTTATLIRTLPMNGLEFSIAGVLLLATALLATARKAQRAPHCRPPRQPPDDHADTGATHPTRRRTMSDKPVQVRPRDL